MRKLLNVLCLGLMLSILAVVPAFASDSGVPSLEVQFLEISTSEIIESGENSELPGLRVPALPYRGIIEGQLFLGANGNLHLWLHVEGQGVFLNPWSTHGSVRTVSVTPGIGWAPVLTFQHTFDLGPLRPGNHVFEANVRCSSTNSIRFERITFTI